MFMKNTLKSFANLSATGSPVALAKGSTKVAQKILSKTTKAVPFEESLVKKKFNMAGTTLGVAGAGIVSAVSGLRELDQERRGVSSQEVYKATPSTPNYEALNAGATGDLVFDLHSLRRG